MKLTQSVSAALVFALIASANAQQAEPSKSTPAEQPATTEATKADAAGTPAAKPKGPTLYVGEKAPALSIAKWVKGDEVKSFESGKVYVVEFWATWCGPCRVSIPHLSELQAKYKDKGVTIIGVSSSESRGLRDVEPFVAKQGDKMAYTVAWDDAGKTNTAWMDASGQEGIPTAFIVNQDGQVAWIGHPMDGLDSTLEKVVSKNYDLVKEAKLAKRRVEIDAASRPLLEEAEKAMASGDKKKVVEILDQIIAIEPTMQGMWVFNKFHLLATELKELDKAYAFAKSAAGEGGAIKNDALAMNAIAWTILDDEGIERRDVPLAKSLAEQASKLTGDKEPTILDTYARALFDSGEKDRAIEVQTKAVNLAPVGDMKTQLQDRLNEYTKKNVKG